MSVPSRRFAETQLPTLGVGITYSSAIEPLLEQCPRLVDVLEIEPQTTWLEIRNGTDPYRVSSHALEHMVQLPGHKLVHSIGVPVGGTVRPQPAQLTLLRRTIKRLNSPWASEHLSFNSTPEFKTGFFLPPRQTSVGIETAVLSIQDLQQALAVPIAVETGVNYLQPRSDEMADGAFVAAVVEAADCGILLDLHNIFTNALNGRQSVEDFLAQIPLDRVWEVHLAGGFEMEGFWLDAHSGAMPNPLIELARQVLPCLPNLKAVIFEIYPPFVRVVGLDTLRAQLEKIHELWDLRVQTPEKDLPSFSASSQDSIELDIRVSPTDWERALGALVIGRSPNNEVERELAKDRGVRIVNQLICEFRGSMLVNTMRLTVRLMMLTLGQDVFRAILDGFWSKTPPQQYGSTEAEAFAEYLVALNLQVPQLNKVLEFERTVLATLIDDQPRVVTFDFDPLPLLRALAEGRLPEMIGQSGQFEIEVTPNGPISATSLDVKSVQQVFPFH
jgi:uncharacterized protein